MDDYLPLAYLNAWEYCPRRFYWEYMLGESADNEHLIWGRHLHRNIDDVGEQWQGETLIRQQQWVWHDRLRIKGIIDAVEETAGILVPVEYKKGRMARHLNDHFQLCAAALCLEVQTGQTITQGAIFYHGNRRRETVIFTETLRSMTENAIATAHQAVTAPMPKPITHKAKCRDCSLLNLCLPQEVLLLQNLPSE